MTVLCKLAALVTAALIAASAGADPLIVIDARGTVLKTGMHIDSARPLSLKEGERVTVIGPDGRTVTLRGPFSGLPMGRSAGASNPRAALAALIATRNARTSSVGVVRSGETAAPLPDPWLIDVSRAGERCLRAGERPVWWRPPATAAAAETLTVMPIDRSWRAEVRWAAGQRTLTPPPFGTATMQTVLVMRVRDTDDYFVRINEVPADLPNDLVLTSWLLEKGCVQQADALLRKVEQAIPPAEPRRPR